MSSFGITVQHGEGRSLFYVYDRAENDPIDAFTRRATAEAFRAQLEHTDSRAENPCPACLRAVFDCAAPACQVAAELGRQFIEQRKREA